MSRAVVKPVPVDPIIGRRVRVLRGEHAGKTGRATKSFRGRVATPDRIMVELDGFMPGWGINSLPAEDIEVLP